MPRRIGELDTRSIRRKRRAPTDKEKAVGTALSEWFTENGAECIGQTELSKGRWTTTWRTPFGCLIVTTVDNRIAAIAAQIPHDEPGAMLDRLTAWASAAWHYDARRASHKAK